MEKEMVKLYLTILHEKRKYVLETIERLREISQVKEMESELVEKVKHDLADQGSDSLGREESFMLISRELQYLYRIDHAIKLIQNGQYGICRKCGKEISLERLEAVPTTDICIICKNRGGFGLTLN